MCLHLKTKTKDISETDFLKLTTVTFLKAVVTIEISHLLVKVKIEMDSVNCR